MPFQDANRVINELIRNAETLGALAALLSERAGDAKPHEAAIEKYSAVQRAIDPNLFDGVSQEQALALRLRIFSRVRRALEVAEAPDQPPAWAPSDPVVIQTQGKASQNVTRLICEFAERTPELADLLKESARFLDVGSGAGWISISMAQRWPLLQVDGLEIHDPALELARQNVEATGLTERVTFHRRNVADLDSVDAYMVAFIPFVFIPETVLQKAIPALSQAIKKGGWLFVACYRQPDGALDRALWDLQTTMSGGRVWSDSEVADFVGGQGFELIEDIGEGNPINLYAIRKT